jgi:hypothetical protein
MLENIQTVSKSYKVLDIDTLPDNLRRPLAAYVGEIGANMELDFHHGRYLLHVNFSDAIDDDTPDDVVEQLANGTIGFDQYPFDGIFWDGLGVEPASYAGYLRTTRYLRAKLPPEVVEQDELYFLV